jgi:capsular polysaccharide biosynthesis protein
MSTITRHYPENLAFLRLLYQKRMLVILFVLATTLVAFTVTLFIPKEYTSSATVFATESNSIDDAIRNPQFGYDVEADRLIQVLNSRDIRDSIVKQFSLVAYYRIDTTEADWYYQLTKKYEKDFTVTKTVYMSVIISARTRDPQMSADIANAIIRYADRAREKLLKKNIYTAIRSLESEYLTLKHDLDSLNGMVENLTAQQGGVTQFMHSEKYLSLIMDKARMSGYESSRSLQLLINHYNMRLSWFYDTEVKLKNARLMANRPLPAIYVVEKAIPSYKKSYPRFSVNLLIGFGGSLVFILLYLYLGEILRSLRNRLRA